MVNVMMPGIGDYECATHILFNARDMRSANNAKDRVGLNRKGNGVSVECARERREQHKCRHRKKALQ